MTFSWRQYITVAEKMAVVARDPADPSAEGALRSAVSRSYYAAFHFWSFGAKKYAHLDLNGSGDDHHRVPRSMQNSRFRTNVSRLRSLREWRQACDYQQSLGEIDSEMFLTEALNFARWSEKAFGDLEPENP